MLPTPDPDYFDKRVTHFFELRLPVEFWTHEAHLGVAFWLLSIEPSVEKALPTMREGIKTYNESVGTANTTTSGYHETLTRFWLEAMSAYLKSHPVADATSAFHQFLRTEASHAKLPWRWYSHDYLMSSASRMDWAAPDLQALSNLETFMKNPRQIHYALSEEALETEFEKAALPPAWFTHEAHLRLAWWHIRKYGVVKAEQNIQAQIQQYTKHLDEEAKYHRTLTHAAIQTLHHFMQKQDANDFGAFLALHPALLNDFQQLINSHYSPELLNSVKARMEVIPPDLLPYPA